MIIMLFFSAQDFGKKDHLYINIFKEIILCNLTQ